MASGLDRTHNSLLPNTHTHTHSLTHITTVIVSSTHVSLVDPPLRLTFVHKSVEPHSMLLYIAVLCYYAGYREKSQCANITVVVGVRLQ